MKTMTEVDVSRVEHSSDIVARRCLSMTSFPPLAVAQRRVAETTRNGRLHCGSLPKRWRDLSNGLVTLRAPQVSDSPSYG
jgi:hypothetical protein